MSAAPSRRGFLGLLVGIAGAPMASAVAQGAVASAPMVPGIPKGGYGGLWRRVMVTDYPRVVVERFRGFGAGPAEQIGAEAAGMPPGAVHWVTSAIRAGGACSAVAEATGKAAPFGAALACAATARLLKSPGGQPSPAGRRGALTALREPRPACMGGRPGLGFAVRLDGLAGTADGLGGRA